MMPWIILCAIYVLGALLMWLLVVEWHYSPTPRTIAVCVMWPLVAFVSFVAAFL